MAVHVYIALAVHKSSFVFFALSMHSAGNLGREGSFKNSMISPIFFLNKLRKDSEWLMESSSISLINNRGQANVDFPHLVR